MADEFVQVKGLDDFKAKLQALPQVMRRSVLRKALSAGARIVRDTAKRQAPVLAPKNIMKAPYRKPGTVRDAIVVRTSKYEKRAGNVGVFVNVRPAKGAKFRTVARGKVFGIQTQVRVKIKASQRGAKSRDDPFYWRWLEFGTRKMAARPFLQKGADRLGDALGAFEKAMGKWLKKVESTGRVVDQ